MIRHAYNRRGSYGKRHELTHRQADRLAEQELRSENVHTHKRNYGDWDTFKRNDQWEVWYSLARTMKTNLEL